MTTELHLLRAQEAPMTDSALRRDFVKVVVLPTLTLLLVPLLAFGFCAWQGAKWDAEILESISLHVDASPDLSAEGKAEAKTFYAGLPASSVCFTSSDELAKYREGVCEAGGNVWQFAVARLAALIALGLGVLGLLGTAVLGLLVWRKPGAQYAGFVTGWAGLTLLTGLEVVLQGALLTWLSFWVTAIFFNFYAPKLILIAAVLAIMGVWTALRAIFRRVPLGQDVDGEVLTEQQAPALWARLRELASKVGTQAPAHLVAGIDDNFFVTEAGLTVGGRKLDGRALYVSLPLLRVLSAREADAVLAHELAHFSGGDTTASARLGPALVRYDTYVHELGEQLLTIPAAYVMRMFRAVFELARQKEKRARELRADAVSALHTAADELSRALLKTTAYSSHRSATEKELFEHDRKHEQALALKDRIAGGLGAHVATAQFKQAMSTLNVPHPFDSHPPLEVRLGALGSTLTIQDCEALLAAAPAQTWAEQVQDGQALEDRLWAAYEARFASAHELALAYRYLPATDEERALVEKHFPAKSFPTKDGGAVRVNYVCLELEDGSRLPLREIASAQIEDGNFSTFLVLHHEKGAPSGKGPTKVKLKPLGKAPEQEAFKQTFAQYWQRDQAARAYQAEQRATAPAGT